MFVYDNNIGVDMLKVALLDTHIENLQTVCEKIRFFGELHGIKITVDCISEIDEFQFYNILFVCSKDVEIIKRILQINILANLIVFLHDETNLVPDYIVDEIHLPRVIKNISEDKQLIFRVETHSPNIFDTVERVLKHVIGK